jgi:hypothetical protein
VTAKYLVAVTFVASGAFVAWLPLRAFSGLAGNSRSDGLAPTLWARFEPAVAATQDKGPEPSVSRASDLVRRWRVVIGTTFEERRATAMEPIMDEIEIVISPGAVRATQDRANEQQVKAADALMQRFALAMVAAAQRLPDGSVYISEETIDAGLQKVCPAYPLCPK